MKLAAAISALTWLAVSGFGARAESVYVKYRGEIDLKHRVHCRGEPVRALQRHDISRQLIRVWAENIKRALDEDAEAAIFSRNTKPRLQRWSACGTSARN